MRSIIIWRNSNNRNVDLAQETNVDKRGERKEKGVGWKIILQRRVRGRSEIRLDKLATIAK